MSASTVGDEGEQIQQGLTDSELAFCALLERLRAHWLARARPSLESRREVVEGLAAELRKLDPANFLYCDGDALFAHGDRRHEGDGPILPPGLGRLQRHCPSGGDLAADGLHIEARGDERYVVRFCQHSP